MNHLHQIFGYFTSFFALVFFTYLAGVTFLTWWRAKGVFGLAVPVILPLSLVNTLALHYASTSLHDRGGFLHWLLWFLVVICIVITIKEYFRYRFLLKRSVNERNAMMENNGD